MLKQLLCMSACALSISVYGVSHHSQPIKSILKKGSPQLDGVKKQVRFKDVAASFKLAGCAERAALLDAIRKAENVYGQRIKFRDEYATDLRRNGSRKMAEYLKPANRWVQKARHAVTLLKRLK